MSSRTVRKEVLASARTAAFMSQTVSFQVYEEAVPFL